MGGSNYMKNISLAFNILILKTKIVN